MNDRTIGRIEGNCKDCKFMCHARENYYCADLDKMIDKKFIESGKTCNCCKPKIN